MGADQIRLDVGCGGKKRDGFIGLDFVEQPGVDVVLDVTTERWPFDDRSVDEVFSSHFLEHIAEPNHVLSEIGRVCKDGARIRFITPYAFSNEAFVYGHLHFLTEEPWRHFCVTHRDIFAGMLGGRWQLHTVTYVVPPDVVAELTALGIGIPFAVRYLKNVVYEFGVDIEFRSDMSVPAVEPEYFWATERDAEPQSMTVDRAFTRNGGHSPPGRLRRLLGA
jgi:predicted SAM-dependent methyltransferase